MSRQWYGSVNNRIDEGHFFNGTKDNIQVGTYLTYYMWSDRHAYEVVAVQDQQHISIRQLKAIRTDNYGMSDAQNYRYESDETRPIEDLEFRRGKWYKVYSYNKAEIMKRIEKDFAKGKNDFKTIEGELGYALLHAGLTEGQKERFYNGATIKKYREWNNISFGVADEYYDYSF